MHFLNLISKKLSSLINFCFHDKCISCGKYGMYYEKIYENNDDCENIKTIPICPNHGCDLYRKNT